MGDMADKLPNTVVNTDLQPKSDCPSFVGISPIRVSAGVLALHQQGAITFIKFRATARQLSRQPMFVVGPFPIIQDGIQRRKFLRVRV